MKKSVNQSLLAATMFFAFVAYAVVYTQYLPYLNSLNITGAMRMLLLISAAFLGIIMQFIVGYLSDKNQTTKKYVLILTACLGAVGILCYGFKQQVLLFYMVTMALTIALFRVTSNLLETWIYQIDDEIAKHFGIIRLFGSIGWSVGALLIGYIIEKQGYQQVALSLFLVLIITLILIMLSPDSQKLNGPVKVDAKELKTLLTQPTFMVVVLIYLILFTVYNLDSLTLTEKMLALGIQEATIGSFWFLVGIIEVPIMFYGHKIMQNFKPFHLLCFASIILALRYILYGFSQNMTQIMLITLLQAVTFPLILLTQKAIVNLVVAPNMRTSGHMIMTSVTSNIPVIVLPVVTTFLNQYLSLSVILILGGIFCLSATLLTLPFLKR